METLPAPTVQLRLESQPENVALVRAMLAGMGERLGFGPELLADLKTAVSEACNNVVIHAYPHRDGPMLVCLTVQPDVVDVTVADRGAGIADHRAEDHPGVGFAVINALAAQAEFDSVPGQGTTVRMRFAFSRDEVPRARWDGVPARNSSTPPVAGEVVVTVAPVDLLAAILGRVAACVAAVAHFSIDRYSDLYLVTDGIAAHARNHASADRISAGLAARPRRIDLMVGPLVAGTAAELQPAGDGAPPMVLALLVDQMAVESRDGSEAIRLMLTDKRVGEAASD